MKLNITMDGRRFYRSTSDQWIFGICGGIARHFGWKSSYVRLATAAGMIIVPGISTLTFIILYVLAGLLIPADDQA
ncbi:MAG: PspC domain-containing protein [Thermomicrobiales bacterium]|nr:PspC domain-containing protein [Thermomicrobiales bacterium]MCO5219790.1 PspC domain-containing protein [Thermomicrobiales bacterium]MCO5225842.1 PspC domain-containing protein [Thermomicrobiales bacterium]MCO5228399.1 PspC domain-containing protein [Thermomicrobiales bacterium]